MNIQLNTDNHIQGSHGMAEWVNAIATQYLGRFDNDLTRLEVHLSDANGDKHGSDDKHCAIEARPRSGQPVGVSHSDEDVGKALRGACTKLRTRLDQIMEQKRDHNGPRHQDGMPLGKNGPDSNSPDSV